MFRGSKAHAASSLEASMQGLLAAAPDLHAERGARPEAVQAVPTDNLCACTVDCERQTLWTVTTDNPCARAVDDAIQATCRAPQKSVALAQRRNPRDPTSTPEVDARTHTLSHAHTGASWRCRPRSSEVRRRSALFRSSKELGLGSAPQGAGVSGLSEPRLGSAPQGHLCCAAQRAGTRQCAARAL